MKNIVIISGHPDSDSLSCALAKAYTEAAKAAGANCNLIDLGAIKFDPILHHGFNKRTDLEPDLLKAQDLIAEANHLVFVFPIWWANLPAILKGFIDRVFLPGFAFKGKENSVYWDKCLTKKTAHIITLMDAPIWYYKFMYRNSAHNALIKGTLKYCGIKTKQVTTFTPIKTSTLEKRKKWIAEVSELGKKEAIK
ncbi:MAG: NAD(P)H-dependent oxidoreductase [Bacteroidales bacterium]|nr:NAD(P)H-dependent oxidoreductase [Bacteroidales bacterium]